MKIAYIGIDLFYPVLIALEKNGCEIEKIFTCKTDNITEFNIQIVDYAKKNNIPYTVLSSIHILLVPKIQISCINLIQHIIQFRLISVCHNNFGNLLKLIQITNYPTAKELFLFKGRFI